MKLYWIFDMFLMSIPCDSVLIKLQKKKSSVYINTTLDVTVSPENIEDTANRAPLNLLSSESKQQYDISYNRFIEWCKIRNVFSK